MTVPAAADARTADASTADASTAAAPLSAAERAPAPDLARGVALLGIALANSVIHLTGRDLGPGLRPVDGTTADRVVDAVVGTLVDNRAFPMFTLLFAYGIAVVVRRQAERGAPWPVARSLVLRRSLWLFAFGVAHFVLLFEGDILASYGVLGLALLLVVRARRRTLVVVGAVSLLPYLALHGLDGLGGIAGAGAQDDLGLPFDTGTALGALLGRALLSLLSGLAAPVLVLALVSPAVVGVLLARARVLERPAEHLPLLRRLTVGGFAVSVLGAVPMVLASVRLVEPGPLGGYVFGALHAGTGLAGAVAFAALVGWTVGARQQRAAREGRTWVPTGPATAMVAVGRRSLTCYLLQSVLMVPLLAPWALGLGGGAGTATVAAVAVATYAVTVVVAVALARADRTGPAEALLRRLVYGRPRARAAG